MAIKPATNAHELLRQWEDVSAQRAGFQSVWQEIADHLLGRRDFTTTATPGRKRMARIYDTTGLQTADLLSADRRSIQITNSRASYGPKNCRGAPKSRKRCSNGCMPRA